MSRKIEQKIVWDVVDEINGDSNYWTRSISKSFESEAEALEYANDQRTKERQMKCLIQNKAKKVFEVGAMSATADSARKESWTERIENNPEPFCTLIINLADEMRKVMDS